MTVQDAPAPPAGTRLTPEAIIRTGFAFWGSKVLLTAVELGVFSELGSGTSDARTLGDRLGLAPRGRRDFLDALVALGLLHREGDRYSNTAETACFLDRAAPSYIGAILEVANAQFYPHWDALPEALRTGAPQHGLEGSDSFLEALRSEPERLDRFMRSMTALSQGASAAIARRFPWDRYSTFVDLGCAQGGLPVSVALAHPHVSGGGFDRPEVGATFTDYVAEHGLSDRLVFHGGDFFEDPLPAADVMALGHVLHGSSLAQKQFLLSKVHDALPDGGAVIVFDAVIDDERETNAFGLLMSLNMLVHTPAGFDYTGRDCRGWLHDAGFRHTYVEHLAGPDSMVVGIK